jgi:hypothetical protein
MEDYERIIEIKEHIKSIRTLIDGAENDLLDPEALENFMLLEEELID